MHYYPHHVGDYQRDTAHLTLIEHGAYRLLMDAYYVTERPLPADHAALCRLVRAISKPEREAVAAVMKLFFREEEGALYHRRIQKELGAYYDQKEKASRAGKVSAMKRQGVTNTQRALNARSTGVDFMFEQNGNADPNADPNGDPNAKATNQDPEPEPGTSNQGDTPQVPGVSNELSKPPRPSSGTGTGPVSRRPELPMARIWADELGIAASVAELWWHTRDTSDWWKSDGGRSQVCVRRGGEKSDLQVFANRAKQRDAEHAERVAAARAPKHPAYNAATVTAGLTGDEIGRF